MNYVLAEVERNSRNVVVDKFRAYEQEWIMG